MNKSENNNTSDNETNELKETRKTFEDMVKSFSGNDSIKESRKNKINSKLDRFYKRIKEGK